MELLQDSTPTPDAVGIGVVLAQRHLGQRRKLAADSCCRCCPARQILVPPRSLPLGVGEGEIERHLPPLPVARALLNESGHALLLVLGAEQAVEQAALEADALAERVLE